LFLGLHLGFWLGGREVRHWREFLRVVSESQAKERQSLVTAMESQSESSRGERERLLHHLVTMRQVGFVPMAEGDDGGDLESWALTDEHEAEVSDRRRNGGTSSAERSEIAQVIEDGLRGRPLRE
jgi:hypothetical protein